MASSLQKKKEEISKLRRKTQRELEKAKSLSRSSTSGVTSLKKRVETTQSHLSEISSDLHRRVSQQESIMRLVAAAQERLKREKELKEQTEQEAEFADSEDEKQQLLARIRVITDKIEELGTEIKQRNVMARKIVKPIEEYQKSKSKFSNLIKRQSQTRPELVAMMRTSTKNARRLAKQLTNREKREESVKSSLVKVSKMLAIAAKKRKSKPKRKSSKKQKKKKARSRPKKIVRRQKKKARSKPKKIVRRQKKKAKKRKTRRK